MSKIEPFNYKEVKPKQTKVFVEGINVIKIKGPKGDTPTKRELIELIKPLIPDPLPGPKGDKGDSYILKKQDKEEIASNIEVPIVEKVIEKREIIKEKSLPLKDSAEEVRDKLESLVKGKKLSIQAIEGLAKILEDLSRKDDNTGGYMRGSVHNSKSSQIKFIDDETPTGVINGVNTIFTLKYIPAKGSLKFYRGGGRLRINEDYTLSQKEITLLIAPQVGEILLCDYRVV